MTPDPISSLFLLHTGSNVGYAIAPLETLFYDVGLEVGGGDPQRVHFGYRSLARGHPMSLPRSFGNVFAFDFADTVPANLQRLASYVGHHHIRLVVIFDMQPVHPLFKSLRRAGATSLLCYWGAPISSRMPAWKRGLKRLQAAISRSRADGLIFESQAMADLAMYGRGIPADMIDVIPLGVDTTAFAPERSGYVYDALELPRDRKVVIYTGHMERRKGVHTLIEAAIEILTRRRRSDVCFLLCGNAADQSKEYERMYAGLGIEDLIRFGGYRSDLPRIYPDCFCGIIPSTGWDSFPRTSLEMAAAGLPVVASRLHGLPEAVLDGQTGLLFEPGNAQALADRLELLLDQPALAAEYGRRGRERCERELSLQAHRARLLAAVRRRLN